MEQALGKTVLVGKFLETESGAIWTIPKNEVKKIQKSEEGIFFLSDKLYCTDSGFEFGLELSSLGGGKEGVVWLHNVNKVPMKLEGTLTIQLKREWGVKVSGFLGSEAAAFHVPQLFSDTRRDMVVEVRMRSYEEDTTAGDTVLNAVPTKGVVASTKAEVAAVEEPWSLEKALENLGEVTTKEKEKKSKNSMKKERRKQKLEDSKMIKKGDKYSKDEESNDEEDSAMKEELRGAMVDKIERLQLKLMTDEEELKGINAEVDELVEEQRRSRKSIASNYV